MWIKYNGKRINLSNKDIQLEHTTFDNNKAIIFMIGNRLANFFIFDTVEQRNKALEFIDKFLSNNSKHITLLDLDKWCD